MMQLSELASTFNLWGLDSLVANTLLRVEGFSGIRFPRKHNT